MGDCIRGTSLGRVSWDELPQESGRTRLAVRLETARWHPTDRRPAGTSHPRHHVVLRELFLHMPFIVLIGLRAMAKAVPQIEALAKLIVFMDETIVGREPM